jgi:hypothetical protein
MFRISILFIVSLSLFLKRVILLLQDDNLGKKVVQSVQNTLETMEPRKTTLKLKI